MTDFMSEHFAVLIDKKVVPVKNIEYWAQTFGAYNRQIIFTLINRRKHISVSTVFLGINSGFFGTPIWFESMIFGTSLNEYQCRYETYEQAEKGHTELVRRARQARQIRNRPFNWKKFGLK